MNEINLLPAEEKSAERFELLKRRLSVASIVLLVVTAVFTLAVLIMFTSLANKRNTLVLRVEESSGKINALKANEELIVVVKNKTSSAQQILSGRMDTVNIFNNLVEFVPQGLYFTDVKLSPEKIVISGKARTSADVASLVSAISSSRGAELFSWVTVDSLSADEAGVYSFSLSAGVIAD